MNRVLITGAAGLLGRVVLETFRQAAIPTTGLVLSTVDEIDAGRVVVGDARDPAVVADALRDVDAVVHLAAIPSPDMGTPEEVFCGNTAATFTVLQQAARAGVRRAVIASSYSVTGLPFAPTALQPPYLPIDEAVPLQIADPYALSKQVDELTAALMWQVHKLSVVALRFPFLGDVDRKLPARARVLAQDPYQGTRDLWSYLDVRDAANVCLAGLTVAPEGCHVVSVAAPVTLSGHPTEALLDRYYPDVPRRMSFPGRTAPFDLTRARTVLGFDPVHLFGVAEGELA
jgi:nucleoside-diphosphate-sugar epimerase